MDDETPDVRVSAESVMNRMSDGFLSVIGRLVRQNALLNAGTDQLSADLADATAKLVALEHLLAELQSELDTTTKELASTRAELASLQSMVDYGQQQKSE